MGRVGSSFWLEKLSQVGLGVVFEPFNGIIEGNALLNDARAAARLRCLYSCGESCTPSRGRRLKQGARAPSKKEALERFAEWKSRKEALDRLAERKWVKLGRPGRGPSRGQPLLGKAKVEQMRLLCSERTIAIKTTRVIELSAVASLPPSLLRETRYVLLLRDPRAVWESLRHFQGWAVSSIRFTCSALETQLRTAPTLAAASPTMLLYYERWSQQPQLALCDLARWLGLQRLPSSWQAERCAGSVPPVEWTH